jgi:hypothetical protein
VVGAFVGGVVCGFAVWETEAIPAKTFKISKKRDFDQSEFLLQGLGAGQIRF